MLFEPSFSLKHHKKMNEKEKEGDRGSYFGMKNTTKPPKAPRNIMTQ